MKTTLADAAFPQHHFRFRRQVRVTDTFGVRTSKSARSECANLPSTVFSEAAQSDAAEQASQSVPTVSTSTPGPVVPGAAGSGEERDDVLLEPDADKYGRLSSDSICCDASLFIN